MSIRSFIKRTRLLLEQGLYESRKALRDEDVACSRPVQVTQLEERILMSASPVAVVANAPDAAPSAESANGFELSDQQLLDVVADSVLPSDEPTVPAEAAEGMAVAKILDSGESSYGDTTTQTLELVFIDSGVSNIDQMIADLKSESDLDDSRTLEVVVLDARRDGIAQITSALLNYDGIDGIHIVSHGSDGSVQLGATTLSLNNLNTYQPAISAWQHSLSDNADLLFYGCNLAATEDGQELMNQIAAACDCDVAASEDLTGHEELGGDWDLEYSTGTIESNNAFSVDLHAGWVYTLDLSPTGGETLIHQTTTGTQVTTPYGGDNVATDADGNFVVVWDDSRSGNVDVYARVFNADGSARTGDILVNTHTTNRQEYAAVAMDADGDFVVTWSSNLQDGSDYGVYFQRFDSLGNAQGSETRVNTLTTGQQDLASIGMADDGSFVISFSNVNVNLGDVYAQRYTSTGTAIGGNFRVNTNTVQAQWYSSVDVDSDGDFVVVWESANQDGSGHGIYGQRYDSSGVAQGTEFRVNTTVAGQQLGATVDMAADGSFVVAWDSAGQDGSGLGVYAQRYNAGGVVQGSEFQVNTSTVGDQDTAAIDVTADGRFVVSWQSAAQDGNLEGIFAQEFDAFGNKVGAEVQVNTTTTGNQEFSSVAFANNDAVIVWGGNGTGDTQGVFAQQFDLGPDITSGLILHHTFDVDATDSSGNNYHAKLANGATIDSSAGTNRIGGGKLSLDGTSDYVDFSDHATSFDNLTQGTIAVWVYHDVNSRDVIFEMSDSGDADSRLALFRDADGSFDFYVREGNTTLLDVSTAAGVIPQNTWTHVAVTVDGSGNKLYVNGVQQTGLTYAAGSASTNVFFDDVSQLDFGSWGVDKYDGTNFVRYFDGFLDDGRVYDRTLSASDITELFNYSGGDITSNLVMHLTLDDGVGSTAVDETANNNDGNLNGGASWTSGEIGGGLAFDYTNGEDYIDVPNSPTLENIQEGDYTLSSWFRPDSTPPGSGGDNDANYGIIIKTGWHNGLYYGNDNRFHFDHVLTGNTAVGSTSADTFAPGQFYHVVGVVDRAAGTVSLYVDGQLQDTSSFTPGTAAREYGTETWKIGIGSPGAGSYGWAADGAIDDARLYGRALSLADVAELTAYGGASITTTTFQQGVNGYSSTIDTFVDQLNPNDNNSGDPTLQVDLNDGANDTAQTLIRFDNIIGAGGSQIPDNVYITDASLTVNVTNLSSSGATISMHEMLVSWSDTSTWNSMTGGVSTNDIEAASTPVSTLANPASTGIQTFNGLESSIQSWMDGASTNYGWVIVSDSDNGWDMDSSESSNKPLLSVSYVTAGSQASAVHTLTVDTTSDVLDGDATSIDTLLANKGADGKISLREAIWAANNTTNVDASTPDVINFAIGTGAQTIMVGAGGLPTITDELVLDATTQTGYVSTPLITLDGTNATGSTGGIVLRTNNSTVSGFIVQDFPDEGIEIDGSTGFGDNNIIENNWVGLNAAGVGAGNGDDGILVTEDADNNEVRNNIVGANAGDGIHIRNNSDGNWVWGNTVGLATDGAAYRANSQQGIHISGSASNNRIGTNNDSTDDALERNVISGNALNGIYINTSDGTIIAGNYIGTNSLGTLDRGNGGAGVYITSASGTAISDNVVSGNDTYGIQIIGSSSSGTVITGNYVGLNAAGTGSVLNTDDAIYLSTAGTTTIGGTGAGEGNVINAVSGKTGIDIYNTTSTSIEGNYIGTNAAGDTRLSGGTFGINAYDAANTQIGGTTGNAANIVAGYSVTGINVGGNSSGSAVQGNFIGTNAAGLLDLTTGIYGVTIQNAATGVLVGGTSGTTGNTIAYNATNGIRLFSSAGDSNSLLRNRIYNNGAIGIDLQGGVEDGNGVTDNDLTDGDSGPNNLQNFPVFSQANLNGTNLTVSGSLDTDGASTQYRIEFFGNAVGTQDATNGEGRFYLGTTTVTTDGSGDATFSGVVLNGVTFTVGDFVTATATRIDNPGQVATNDLLAYGATSEFAANFAISESVNQAPVNSIPSLTASVLPGSIDGPSAVGAGDFNGDGFIDIVAGTLNDTSDASLSWYQNDGTESFTQNMITTGGMTADGIRDLDVADVDSDGDLDIVTVSATDNRITWWSNDGSGSFTQNIASTSLISPRSVVAVDFDGDGDTDIIAGGAGSGDTIHWLENDGSEVFTARTVSDIFTADFVTSLSVADIDGDSDLDIVAAAFVGDKFLWFEHQGGGTFVAHTIDSGASVNGAVYVSVADIDDDGDLDVATAASYANVVSWYKNDGAGNFGAGPEWSVTANGARSVLVADLEGDGDVDIIAGASTDSTIIAHLNDGAAIPAFTGQTISTTSTLPIDLAMSDIDSDGDLDLIEAAFNEDEVRLYENYGGFQTTADTLEDTPLTFSAANGNLISISDADAGGASVQVTLTSTNGTVTLSQTTGLTITPPADGTSDAVIEFTGTIADINAALDGLVFTPTSNFVGSANLEINTNDLGNTGSGGAKSDVDNISINVISVNDAPTLDNNGFMSFSSINEDQTSNSGNLVSEIIASATGDRITDPDSGAVEGIAIYTVSTGNGTWQYNTGSGWTDIGTVSSASALLLRSTDSVRYVPDEIDSDFASILFKAWDQTTGAFGTKVDVSTDGGSTAFSSMVEVAIINVTAVNDQAIADLNGSNDGGNDFAVTFTEGLGAVSITDTDATISDVDNSSYQGLGINLNGFVDGSSEQITVGGHTFTFGVSATVVRTVGGTDFELDFDGSGFTVSRNISGNMPQADLTLLLRGVTYINNSEDPTAGARTIDIIPTDGDGLSGLSSTSTITVVAVNDAPVAVNDPSIFPAEVLAQNPVGYWRLGEPSGTTATNLGSLGTNGTYNGPTLAAAGYPASGSDTAADFDGANDNVDLGTFDVAGTGLTLSAWINADDFDNGDARIISKAESSGGNAEEDHWWMLSTQPSGADTLLRFRVKTGGTTNTLVASSGALPAGEWYFASATYDAGTGSMKIFLNGVQVGSRNHTVGGAVSTDATKTVMVGANPNNYGHFDGRIDEVAIFDKALSQSQLQTMFNSGSGGYVVNEDGPLAVSAADGVLANDTDAENDSLTADLVTGPGNAASFTLNADGSFNYTPTANFNGTDTFVYRTYDGTSYSNNATVTINVVAENDAPVFSNLDGNPTFVEDGAAVVLDADVEISDSELSTIDSFDGATLTLARNGGANAEDQYSATGTLVTLNQGSNNLTVGATTIGSVTQNSGGTLVLTFNSNATNALVNQAMQQIAYSNSNDTPPASVQIDWTFDDENSGAQGTGSALQATGSTPVNIVNAPEGASLTVPITQSVNEDTVLTFSSAGSNAIVIDSGSSNDPIVTATLTVGNGTLTLATTTGITFLDGTSNGDATLTIAGTESDLNTALDGLQFQGNQDYNGSDTLTVSTGSPAPTEANLYARYEFLGGAVTDQSGNGYNGTITGNPVLTSDAERGDVMTFEGDDRIDVVGGVSALSDEVTIAAWVNLDAGQQEQVFLSIGDEIYITLDQSNPSLSMGLTASNFTTSSLNAAHNIAGEGWNHVAATVNDVTKETHLYLNGVLVRSSSFAFSDIDWGTAASPNITIGALSDGSNTLVGSLDDVRVYESELTQTDVAAIMGDHGYDRKNLGITIDPINDAPTITNAATVGLPGTDEDSASAGATVSAIVNSAGWNDVDAGAVRGMAVTSVTGNGTWQYSTDGITWNSVGAVTSTNALLLDATSQVRYVGDGENGEVPNFTFRGWDTTTDTASTNATPSYTNPGVGGATSAYSIESATAQATVTAVNDAPVLDSTGAMTLTSISEDDIGNAGQTVASMLASAGGDRVTDVDSGAVEGIAITSVAQVYGNFQYSTDGGSNWNFVGVVSDTSALLLRDTDLIRFNPLGTNGGTSSLTFRAWDQTGATAGQEGTKVDVSTNGGATAFSTVTETTSINVSDVNDAPTLTTFATVADTTNEDTEVEITLAELKAQGDEADVDGTVDAFIVKSITSGTLKIGTSAGTATAWAAGTNDTIDATNKAYWTPATNANGTQNAFQVVAQDNDGGESASNVTVQVSVADVNDLPTLTTFATVVDTTNEDTEVELTFAELAAQGDEADVDGTVDAFIVKSVTTGTLKIGTSAGTATAWAAGTNDTIDATNKAYWTPATNANGTQNAFQVVAQDDDGGESASNVTVQVAITDVNDIPTLTTFAAVVDTTNEDTEVELTFAELAAQGDEADVDGTVDAFIVKSVTTGTLKIGTSAGTATAWAAGTNDTIDATNKAYWTPATNANGTQNAFAVVAKDNSGAESATNVTAQVSVTPVNDDPTITSNGSGPTGAINVAENSNAVTTVTSSDVDGGSAVYSISGADAGSFLIGNSSGVLAFSTAPDYELPSDANGDGVYEVTVTVSDGNGGSDSQAISVTVTNVADTTTLYLDGDTSPPFSNFSTTAPTAPTLVNFDPGRDTFAGLVVVKGGSGANETVDTLHHTWVLSGPVVISSEPVRLNFWTDIKDGMNAGQSADVALGKNATVTAYLLDLATGTTESGGTVIASGSVSDSSWGDGFAWENKTIDFGTVNYAVASGRNLAVKLVVSGSSSDEVWFAYDTATFDSHLLIGGNNAAPVGLPTITGTVTEDQVLTADTSSINDADGLGAFSYQWLRDGSVISGANSVTYTLGDADVGSLMSVEVSYTDGGGTSEGPLASAQTAAVANVNDDPTITAIGDQTIAEDGTTGALAFTVGDVETAAGSLTVTASSANQTIIPDGNLTLVNLGSGNWTIEANPALNQNGGPVTITVTVDDGTTMTDETFTVTVNAGNDAPVLVTNTPLSVPEEGTRTITTAYLDHSDVDNADSQIVYTLTQLPGGTGQVRLNGSTLGLGGTFTQQDINDNRVTFRFSDDESNTSFKFTVSDGTATLPETTFSINGTPVNDAPVNTVPGTQTVNEETQTAIAGLSVTDVDAGSADITTRLQVNNGVLNVDLTGGATISLGANNSTDLTLEGTVTEINAALATLQYTGNTDVVGTNADTLTMTTNDGGNTGSGGALQDVDTVQININNVNDDPTITAIGDQTIAEDGSTGALAFSVGDVETAAGSLTVTAVSSDQTIIPDGNLTLMDLGSGNWTIEAAPAANQNGGPVTITVTVNDGTTTTNETFDVTVTAVNDDPTITAIGDQTIAEDGTTGALAFSVGDVETAAGSLTVTAVSSNQTIIPDGNLTLVDLGSGNWTIEAAPAVNQNGGPVTITVTVDDGTTTTNETFDVTVTAVNDAPVLTTTSGGETYYEVPGNELVDDAVTITDIDSANFDGGQLTVSISANSETASDRLIVRHEGSGLGQVEVAGGNVLIDSVLIATVSGGSGGSDLVITFTSNADAAEVQQVARQVAFFSTSHEPSTAQRTITMQLTDGDGGTSVLGSRTMDVVPVNDAPTGADNTITAIEDTDYIFKAADFGFSDIDGDSFQRVWFDSLPGSGTLKLNGVAFSAGNFVVKGDIDSNLLTYSPVADANGTAIASFTFRVQDTGGTANGGSNVDGTADTITIDVTAQNDAPTLTNFAAVVDTTNEDTEVEITYAELAAQGDEADIDGTVDAFVVKSVTTGTLRIGTSAGTATAWAAGTNDTIDATNKAYWTPASNANGTLNAFAVVAKDNQGAESTTNITAQITVTAVNDAPTGSVTISGTPTEDQTLTASNTLADEDGLGTINYQWQRNGVNIFGATGSTYTLTQTDVGTTIRVVASYTDGQSNAESVSSAGVGPITNVNDAPQGTDSTVSTREDVDYLFTAADFGFSDPAESDGFLAVEIVNHPATGTLYLDADADGNVDAGETVVDGQFVAVGDINAGRLKFRAVSGEFGTGYTTFDFKVQDDGGTANGGVDTDTTQNRITIDVVEAFRIEGNIFEDVNGDSNLADAIGVDSVTVHLYQDSDATAGISGGDSLVATTTTSSGGFYSFVGLLDDTYYVVVDSQTIHASARYNSGYGISDVWAEQTYGVTGALTPDGLGGSAVQSGVGASFGGKLTDVSDDASSLLTAEHVTVVSSTAGNDVANIDSGFSFNVVTGIGDSGQGTLRSFINNANAIAGDNAMRFVPTIGSNQTSAHGDWWTITLSSNLAALTDAGTTIDGTAYDYGDGLTAFDMNNGTVNSSRTVGVDGLILDAVERRELEIDFNGNTDGIVIDAGSATVSDIALFGAVRVGATSGATVYVTENVTAAAGEATITGSVLGARADGSDPGAGRGSTGLKIDGASTITNNYIAYLDQSGGRFNGLALGNSDGSTFENNEVHSVAFTHTAGDAITIDSANNTVRGNYIHDVQLAAGVHPYNGKGIELWYNATSNLIENNTVVAAVTAGIGIGGDATNNIISKNVVTGTTGLAGDGGAGILLTNAAGNPTNNTITHNSVYGNAGIGIDLDSRTAFTTSSGDGVTANDGLLTPGSVNELMDSPVIEIANLVGTNLTLTGYVGSASGQSIFANATVEFFVSAGGEGRTFLGTLTTDGSGNFSGTLIVGGVADTDELVATATSATGNTSEFGLAFAVNGTPTDIAPNAFSVTENTDTSSGYSVGTLTTTDPDTGDTLTYSIIPGGDSAFFAIGGALSDELILTDGILDFETKPSYSVTVQVTDAGGLAYSELLTVNVTGVNEAPVVTVPASQNANEDTSIAISGLSVADEDGNLTSVALSAGNGNLRVLLQGGATISSGGNDTSALTVTGTQADINATLATLSYIGHSNYNGTDTINVLATDSGALTHASSFDVVVAAVNDAPTITSISNQIVPEDTSTGALAFTVADIETADGALTITATSSNQALIPDANLTLVDLSNGSWTVEALPALNQNGGPATITLTVSDGATTTQTTFDVTVTAVNDAPTISAIGDQTIAEDNSTGPLNFTVTDVETTDGALTVTAVSSDQTLIPDANLTLVDLGNGSWTIEALPALNQNGGPATITLTVDDGTTSTQMTFDVVVSAVNDEQTVVTNTGMTIAEGDFGVVISSAMLETTDLENTPAQVVYQVTGVPASGTLFRGGLALNANDTFTQADINAGLITYDHNDGEVFSDSFKSTVDDGSGVSSGGSFAITIQPVNDQAPVITSAAAVGVTENSTAVLTVTATDGDLPSQVLNYAIVGGPDAGRFTLHSASGTLTFSSAPDVEAPTDADGNNVYEVVIEVSDGQGLSAQQTIQVTVSDVDEFDASPIIDTDSGSNSVDENVAVGTAVGIIASSQDADATNNGVTYSLDSNGGGYFDIDSVTGVVTTAAAIDLEAVGSTRTIVVRATSADGSTTTRGFDITINNVNEAPQLSAPGPMSVDENSGIGTSTGAVAASDPDAGDVLSYSIVSGSPDQPFAIDSASGLITVADPSLLNFESNGNFNIVVRVTDGGGLTNDRNVTISINDVNEAPTAITLTGGTIDENSANGTVVGSVTGIDADAGDSLTYSFTNDANGRFAIDSLTGLITVADGSQLNYEVAQSHNVTVVARDSGNLSYSRTLAITVGNVNEPPVAVDDDYALEQLQDLIVPAGGLTANDGDVDGDAVHVVLASGPTHGTLQIAADGSFTFTPTGAYSGIDSFTYYLTDGLLNSNVATVEIDITITVSPNPGGGDDGDTDTDTDNGDGDVDGEDSTDNGSDGDDTSGDTGSGDSETPSGETGETGTTVNTPPTRKSDSPSEEALQAVPQPSGESEALSAGQSLEVDVLLVEIPEGTLLSGYSSSTGRYENDSESGTGYSFADFLFEPVVTANPFLLGREFDLNQNDYLLNRNREESTEQLVETIVIGSTAAVSTSVTVGYVVWLLRGGSLMTTFLSSLPMWQGFDPLPVLESFEEDRLESDDEESLASMVETEG